MGFRLAVVVIAVGLAFFATKIAAQDVVFDSATVDACLASTPSGAVDPSCIGVASNACQTATPGGETTIGIADCIQAETQAWDVLLNREYKATRKAHAGDQVVLDQLLAAQRAWIAFRDAECALAHALWRDGSIRVIVAANCMMVQTARRTIELRDMR
ncbi:Uncharacterized conserved protein YecT, DUF1311 family [Aliiroseovarius sediminilitoris]|uniref:Uncharacterized conserved protein YecT, DUF1311 family n=1 Tax=Aliiroseovarius sediminilitoris TaxID=1173584 RepID=A0A1I0P7Z8_9RHOB|nr:lysozyme inhibitor LprI family protein [Aliiroseovarius sediminilitoris]SEW10209.1 Uncharacterized conserved protein YecT, DUF1311 family [Aliiroseovarius sediminilitoris]